MENGAVWAGAALVAARVKRAALNQRSLDINHLLEVPMRFGRQGDNTPSPGMSMGKL